jgi:hypothetical protein
MAGVFGRMQFINRKSDIPLIKSEVALTFSALRTWARLGVDAPPEVGVQPPGKFWDN